MKMRNKGKVHPCSSSSSSSSSSTSNSNSNTADSSLSVLNLLPAVILTLISALSPEEREVLAYMITRSLATPSLKKQCSDPKSPALFHCDCFHCYTSFWFRWDSSPNRELIHQAIEAFEDHLNNNAADHFNKTPPPSTKNKRKDKTARARNIHKLSADAAAALLDFPAAVQSPDNRVVVVAEESPLAAPAAVVRTHKGLARKVLPDVMGIFSSRLWSLWNPEG